MPENIDGYVTKDDLYRMISRFRGSSKIDAEQANELCEAVKALPNRAIHQPTHLDRAGNRLKQPTTVVIGHKLILAEPFILDQAHLLTMMSEELTRLTEFFSISDVRSRLNLLDDRYEYDIQQMTDTANTLLNVYKEKRL
jgi:hypothetical protein